MLSFITLVQCQCLLALEITSDMRNLFCFVVLLTFYEDLKRLIFLLPEAIYGIDPSVNLVKPSTKDYKWYEIKSAMNL